MSIVPCSCVRSAHDRLWCAVLYLENHIARSKIQRQMVQGHCPQQVPGVPCKSARFGCGFGWDCAIAPVNGHSACGCTAATAQSRAGHTICNANRSSRCRSCYKISPDAAPGTCLAAKGAHPSRKKRAPALLKMHLRRRLGQSYCFLYVQLRLTRAVQATAWLQPWARPAR